MVMGSVSESNSYLSQKIYIPDTATKLSLTYNIVSEESMEYVGSIFDDRFEASILSVAYHSIAEESINASTWTSIPDVDFEG